MITIVMTGGTSGFGKVALKRLLQSGDTRLLLGARRDGPPGAETLPLDLARLDQVRSFAAAVDQKLGRTEIDILIFNAGVSLPGGTRTADGFETTFAVNHLAHYLLLRLFLPKLAQGAKVILTTSGTHDPAEGTIIPPPRHARAKLLANPELDSDLEQDPVTAGGRAYSASKLCVVLTARALAAHPEARKRRFTVVAYDPGATPGTGLVRHSNLPVRIAWQLLGTPILLPFLPKMNSRESAGGSLADLALGRIAPPPGRVYAALRRARLTWPEPSKLARCDDLMEALWRDSATLVGMPE